MKLLIILIIVTQSVHAQHYRSRLNFPPETTDNESTWMIAGAMATTAAVGFLSKKNAPQAVALSGLGVGVCVTLYSRKWKKRQKVVLVGQ